MCWDIEVTQEGRTVRRARAKCMCYRKVYKMIRQAANQTKKKDGKGKQDPPEGHPRLFLAQNGRNLGTGGSSSAP